MSPLRLPLESSLQRDTILLRELSVASLEYTSETQVVEASQAASDGGGGLLMRSLLLAFMLSMAGTGAPYLAPWLVKSVATDMGTMRVYRDPLGCTVTLRGIQVDRVDLVICRS